SGGAELRDRHRRSRGRGALGRLSAVHLPGRGHVLLRPHPGRHPDGAGAGVVQRVHPGLVAVPGPDLPADGDVRARRHCQPDHDERARRDVRPAARAGAALPGTGAHRHRDARRRHLAGRDGLPPAAQPVRRAGVRLPGHGTGCREDAALGGRRRGAGRRRRPVRMGPARLRPSLGADPGGNRSRHPAAGGGMTGALELKDLRKSFGRTEIIRGVDLVVHKGERIGVIGPNGAGKSTLFNLISGRLRPSSGEVRLNGQRIDGLKPYEINRMGLSRSFQITNI
ncbi:MAG: ATP-binding cassette domain-containing protein, partial [Rhodoferax sp.]|nr:ATP-binding cassette domain-containing protein [Rhodoferax sp.]